MICPNCGNSTGENLNCDVCGANTEFIRRTCYCSVGSRKNQEKIQCLVEDGVLYFQTHEKNGEDKSNSDYGKIGEVSERGAKRGGVLGILALTMGLLILLFLFSFQDYGGLFRKSSEDRIKNSPEILKTLYLEKMVGVWLYDNPNEEMAYWAGSKKIPVLVMLGEVLPGREDILDDANSRVWKFVGWNTKSNGEGIFIPAGEILALPLSESIDLYAQWRAEKIPRQDD